MLRRTIGITATAAAISIAAILPAGAQTSTGIDSYAAGAQARALDLSVFGKTLTEQGFGGTFTIADTTAGIDSSPKAVADGLAVFTPVFSSPPAPAATDASGAAQSCATISEAIPAELPLSVPDEAADLVCVNTIAKLVDGKPSSSSKASQLILEIEAPALIGETPLTDIVEGVQGGLGQLFDALIPVTAPIEAQAKIQLVDELQGIVDGLLDEVQEGDVLVRITVAPAASITEFTSAGVSASAVSNGVIVELLPNLPGGALAVATVGSSTSSVVRDAVTGAPSLSGGAALINVTYPNGLLGGLEVLTKALGDAVGTLTSQLPCAGTNPLADVFCFDVGSSKPLNAAEAKAMDFDYGPTTVGQTSSVLNLRVLAAAPGGGVILDVGRTAAAAAATTPLPRPDAPPPPAPLPRTGGDSAMPLTLALLGVGAAGAALLRRSRTI